MIAMVEAHTAIVDSYVSGELVLDQDDVPMRFAHVRPDADLWPEQAQFVEAAAKRVALAVRYAWPDVFDEGGHTASAEDDWKAMLLLGPAGSGKSFAIEKVLEDAMLSGA